MKRAIYKDKKLSKMSKEEIEEINKSLKRGDKRAIAKAAGVSPVHVTRFFQGEDCFTDETVTKILKAVSIVKKRREKKETKAKQLQDAIIQSL